MVSLSVPIELPSIVIQSYSDKQWDTLPHIILTSDSEWDPSVFDTPGDIDNETWCDAKTHLYVGSSCPTFNEFRELRNAHIYEMFYFGADSFDTVDEIDRLIDVCTNFFHPYVANSSTMVKKSPDYNKLQHFFSCLLSEVIRKILRVQHDMLELQIQPSYISTASHHSLYLISIAGTNL